jgi:hypothetical protein
VVEALELDQPLIVTLPMIQGIAEVGEDTARRLAYRLQDLGWLAKLRTRGAWEFIPGARAGRYSSGDRFIEFRAQLAVNPGWPGVLAMESAAVVLGLAQRLPSREVIALPAGEPSPKAMSLWRVTNVVVPDVGLAMIDELPSWNINGLIAGIAIRPGGYHDVPGLAQWLLGVGNRLDAETIESCLAGAPQSVWQRASYLVGLAGNQKLSVALASVRPPAHTVWFGATRTGGHYDPVSRVLDADLAPYLSGGTGA